MEWYKQNISIDGSPDLEIFSNVGFDISTVHNIQDCVPWLIECFREYLVHLNPLAPEVFARTEHSRSMYTLADVCGGVADKFYAWTLRTIFELHYGSNPVYCKNSAKWAVGGILIYFSHGELFSMSYLFPQDLYFGWLEKYCPVGGVVYDASMGWGDRIQAATKWNCGKYLGTDPSTDMWPYYNKWISEHDFKFAPDIRCQGSEEFVPEWEGIVDLCATCPPYYDTEIYSSVDPFGSKENYIKYVFQTFVNCHRYLREGGRLIWYIGDNSVFPDCTKICKTLLETIGYRDIKLTKQVHQQRHGQPAILSAVK